MSNISLGGNHGNSINFDGAALQSQQEDEYRKEEEQQQNEVQGLFQKFGKGPGLLFSGGKFLTTIKLHGKRCNQILIYLFDFKEVSFFKRCLYHIR